MMKPEDWSLSYEGENILLLSGFEKAFIGIVDGKGTPPKACYDYEKCIDIIITQIADETDTSDLYEEAVEYFDFNVAGAYMGESTPVFLRRS